MAVIFQEAGDGEGTRTRPFDAVEQAKLSIVFRLSRSIPKNTARAPGAASPWSGPKA